MSSNTTVRRHGAIMKLYVLFAVFLLALSLAAGAPSAVCGNWPPIPVTCPPATAPTPPVTAPTPPVTPPTAKPPKKTVARAVSVAKNGGTAESEAISMGDGSDSDAFSFADGGY